jgi:hypothetical protein
MHQRYKGSTGKDNIAQIPKPVSMYPAVNPICQIEKHESGTSVKGLLKTWVHNIVKY